MDGNFKKFKKKVWLEILIKCLSCGLAAAGVAVVAVLLPCRLYGIQLFWLYYVLIALGGFIVGGGTAFLIFRTNDKKIAMRLDKELGLHERVQTAYVFSGQQSDILDLQRTDTSATLGGASAASLHFANLAALILAGVIALVSIPAIPVIAIKVPPVFAPKTEAPVIPEEPPRDVTDWEWAALDDLIAYVRASKKADTYLKTSMVNALEDLKDVILDGVSQSSLTMFVQSTVSTINNAVTDANGQYGEGNAQKDLNIEEANYVINRLYSIFNIQGIGGGSGDGEGGGSETPTDPDDGSGDGEGGPDYEIGEDDIPFFDPENGYVSAREERDKYYELVQKALEEGTISEEEWREIMDAYFADL